MATTEIQAKPSQVIECVLVGLRAARPVHLWGSPGTGKSQMIGQSAGRYYAEETGGSIDARGRVHSRDGRYVPQSEYLIDFRAVTIDPVDLRGLPSVGDGTTRWNPPSVLPQGEEGGPVVLFLDELNRAPALVQNAFLELTLDRRIGDYVLPARARVVAAGNRESDGGGVTRLNPALSMRFLHINTGVDLDDWSHWALGNGIDPLVIAFLRYRPNLLCDFDRNARTSPNPRSWSFVSDIAKQRVPRDLERILVAGTVGEGAGAEYLSFVEMYRSLPSIDSILADPHNAPVPTDVATRYAASSALAHRATAQNIDRVLVYLNRLPREFCVFGMRDATTRDPDLTNTKAFSRFAESVSDLV